MILIRVPLIWAVEWLSDEIFSPLIRWEKTSKILFFPYGSYWWLHLANINMSSTAQIAVISTHHSYWCLLNAIINTVFFVINEGFGEDFATVITIEFKGYSWAISIYNFQITFSLKFLPHWSQLNLFLLFSCNMFLQSNILCEMWLLCKVIYSFW